MEKDKLIEEYAEHARKNSFQLNTNTKIVEGIIGGLLKNEERYGKKYCPCRRISGNQEEDSKKICPCIYHKDEIKKDGHCFCGLFIK
ncbi:MAG: ferredoxin-thioredoxin reductase catalytic domain-containing protein [Candidatus Pacebacteria bacterium]|nr:ferredoxin-thioredoxin reductase catalytic domain-containing protein [Candidatus Paceibacterota bacterium]